MSKKSIPFPAVNAWSPEATHSLVRGDETMELKQVHPEYTDDREKQQQMEDAYRACLTKIGALRGMQEAKTA